MRDSGISRIVENYRNFEAIEKYAYRARFEEIRENDFNLNILCYVDTFEDEEEIDIKAVQAEIVELEREVVEVRSRMDEYLRELNLV